MEQKLIQLYNRKESQSPSEMCAELSYTQEEFDTISKKTVKQWKSRVVQAEIWFHYWINSTKSFYNAEKSRPRANKRCVLPGKEDCMPTKFRMCLKSESC